MKYAVVLFSLFVVVAPCSTQQTQWYVLGGFVNFDEDLETGVGEGSGFRGGIGLQISERFGVEGFMDLAPEISPDTILNSLTTPVSIYDISTVGNTYISLGGTLTLPLSNQISGIWKGGIFNYSVELERFSVNEIDLCASVACEDSGTDVFVSGGVMVHINEKASLEFSVTQYNGDAEAQTVNTIFRYRF